MRSQPSGLTLTPTERDWQRANFPPSGEGLEMCPILYHGGNRFNKRLRFMESFLGKRDRKKPKVEDPGRSSTPYTICL